MKKNTYCTIYLVRHGETDWNKQKLVQGQTDIDLNEEGKSQAEKLGEQLKHISFDAVFSSDLLRAKRTAEIAVLEKKLAVETTKLLRERLFGRYEGKPIHALRALDSLYNALEEKDRFSFKPEEDIESDEELVSRFITFVREIAIVYAGKNVLIVSHGGVMRAVLCHLGFARYSEIMNYTIQNTSYVQLETDGVDFFIKDTMGIVKILG